MTTLEKAARALLEAIENSQHAFGGEGTLATAREAAAATISAALLDSTHEVEMAAQDAVRKSFGTSITLMEIHCILRAAGVKITGKD